MRIYPVIVGAGNIGTPPTGMATAGGNEAVVVERDPGTAERATSFDRPSSTTPPPGTSRSAGADRENALRDSVPSS